MILTSERSERLVLSPGTCTVRFGSLVEIPLSKIAGVRAEELLIHGRRSPTLSVSYSKKYLLVLGGTEFSDDPVGDVAEAIQELARRQRAGSAN